MRQLADEVLEVPDLAALARLLTQKLPAALGMPQATLLIWDRKLDAFQALLPGETQARPVRPGEPGVEAPATRFLLSEGEVIETGKAGDGVLVPLMARTGLVGVLVLGGRPERRKAPLRGSEAKLLSAIALRASLALENQVYLRELVSSERMAALGTMAGMLVHDFRGPLTVIRGYAESLTQPQPPEVIRERAKMITDAVDRLERMTRETLDFARGGGRLVRRCYEAKTLVEELAAAAAEEFPSLELVRDVSVPKETVACVDVDKMRRVVGNIAANAMDAMGGRGRFHVSARVENGQGEERRLVLMLADEGPGVPEEIRGRVFEPFVTKGKKRGTGLGLAVARRFVEDHGGTIELLPEGPGARFRIALPLASGAGAA
ncbi:MAG TPA: HAMP domain-containing sensor histidine kinase [Vicinamibacteria bacterium]|nr:HAMP domain-containing sensor histidine kinase [Vicinamibacteria bacterium]